MIPVVRDAILRMASGGPGSDFEHLREYVAEQRNEIAQALTTIEPTDAINIARFQGRIASYDAFLNLVNDAHEAQDKGTNDG